MEHTLIFHYPCGMSAQCASCGGQRIDYVVAALDAAPGELRQAHYKNYSARVAGLPDVIVHRAVNGLNHSECMPRQISAPQCPPVLM